MSLLGALHSRKNARAQGLRRVSLPRCTTDGDGGIMVRPGDASALADAIETFLTRPDAARAAGLRNRARVVAEFSWRASAERLLGVYRRLVPPETSH